MSLSDLPPGVAQRLIGFCGPGDRAALMESVPDFRNVGRHQEDAWMRAKKGWIERLRHAWACQKAAECKVRRWSLLHTLQPASLHRMVEISGDENYALRMVRLYKLRMLIELARQKKLEKEMRHRQEAFGVDGWLEVCREKNWELDVSWTMTDYAIGFVKDGCDWRDLVGLG